MISAPPPGLLDVLQRSTEYLAARGVEDARLDAERLAAHVLGVDRLRLYLDFERPLSEVELDALRKRVVRRGLREPLQQILGCQPFREITLRVTPDTLVPRPETEEVVDVALSELDRLSLPVPRVLDLGTGTGCIAISVAVERPEARVTAVECSAPALAVARENAVSCGVAERLRLLSGDLFSPLAEGERFDLIVSNPPYLTPDEWRQAPPEVRDHEPKAALVGGDDGLACYRRMFGEAPQCLSPSGTVVVEIGATQGEAVAAIAREAGFRSVRVQQDLAGRDRVVVARADWEE